MRARLIHNLKQGGRIIPAGLVRDIRVRGGIAVFKWGGRELRSSLHAWDPIIGDIGGIGH
ncbi:hypothetical protein CCP3SC1AL1_110019 [Gammaproteobacteria bacterium]